MTQHVRKDTSIQVVLRTFLLGLVLKLELYYVVGTQVLG